MPEPEPQARTYYPNSARLINEFFLLHPNPPPPGGGQASPQNHKHKNQYKPKIT